MILMIVLPAWALTWQMFNEESGWLHSKNYLLLSIGGMTMALQAWMVVEAAIMWPRAKGVLEEALPPLKGPAARTSASSVFVFLLYSFSSEILTGCSMGVSI